MIDGCESQKPTYFVVFHLCDLQNQAKPIHSDRSQKRRCLCKRLLLTRKGHEGTFWGTGNVLCVHLDGSHREYPSAQMNT